MSMSTQSLDGTNEDVVNWSDLGGKMWSFLTGRQAAIHYAFTDMAVEVPRDTGREAPRATWMFNGTLTITTSDREDAGAGLIDPTADRT